MIHYVQVQWGKSNENKVAGLNDTKKYFKSASQKMEYFNP